MLNVLLAVAVCTVAFLFVLTVACVNKADTDNSDHWGFLSGVFYSVIVGLCIMSPTVMGAIGAFVLSITIIPILYTLLSTFR